MRQIILFDGVCNFCNRTVNIILAHDKAAQYQFAPNQSIAAINLIQQFGLEAHALNSVVLIEGDKVYTKTDAVIRIAVKLSGWPSIFRWLKLIPKPIRNFAYDLVAQNRYRLFGKRKSCMIPDKSIIGRFLS
jgi:predicted DCC family thiol-disulfide oxidoreductase YuxK